jgi:hypothetical protein
VASPANVTNPSIDQLFLSSRAGWIKWMDKDKVDKAGMDEDNAE